MAVLAAALAGCLFVAAEARAQPAETADQLTFMGRSVTAIEGRYLVLKDVNVRGAPETGGKRLGKLERGATVEAVGAANDAWMAVRQDGQDLGFVYSPVLLPLIDGSLDKQITGTSTRGGDRCAYRIQFEGKNPIDGELFETSDYDVRYHCEIAGVIHDFAAYMFITEAPFALSTSQIYQISLDLAELSGGYDDVLSTIFLFKRREDKVAFDRVTVDRFKAETKPEDGPADSARDAVVGAVEMAPWTWSDQVWTELAGGGTVAAEGAEAPEEEDSEDDDAEAEATDVEPAAEGEAPPQ